jgi:hypothetical protein
MARVVALVPDLLFGSKVQAMLAAGGHDVELTGAEGLRERAPGADVLVVDLTAEPDARIAAAEGLGVPTLAFYSHVEADVRERALAAGFDSVVPRSRMAREGAELVTRLAGTPGRTSP